MLRKSARTTQKKYERALAAQARAPVTELGYTASTEERSEMSLPQRGCMAKMRFRSRAAAVKWIKANPPNLYRHKVTPYQCPRCWQWHMTKGEQV